MPTAGEARLKKAKTVVDRRAKGNLLTLHQSKRTRTNKENVAHPASARNKNLDHSQSRSKIPLAAKRRPGELEITKFKKTDKVPKGKENVGTKQESVAQKGTRKAAPDFSKIHKKWELTMAKGKAVKKKGNTKFEPFVLSENGANQPTKYAYNSDDDQEVLGEDDDKFDEDFKVDHAALQGILNNTGIKYEELAAKGRATIATVPKNTTKPEHTQLAGVLKRTSIYYDGSAGAARKPFGGSVPVSIATTPKSQPHASQDTIGIPASTKKRVAWADNAETEDEFGFKPDNKALQSILDNTGINDRHRQNTTRATLATCSGSLTPFRRTRQNADLFTRPSPKRTSIYYTGPRHPRPRASPARPNINGTTLERTGNQCSGTPCKNTVSQTCYNAASTMVGLQGVATGVHTTNVSTAAVMQPLQQAISTPRDVRLQGNGCQGETNSTVFAVPYAVSSVGTRMTRSGTKAPQPCWADILIPRTQGSNSADVLTPRTQRPTMSKAPPPVYDLGTDVTPQPLKQRAPQSLTTINQGVKNLEVETRATDSNRPETFTNQTTPLLQSVTPRKGAFGNSCAPEVGSAPLLQQEKTFGNIVTIERPTRDYLKLGVPPSTAPGCPFGNSSVTVTQSQVPLHTGADVTTFLNDRAPLSTPQCRTAPVSIPQKPSETYGSFPVPAGQYKVLQALEEQARRDLELLRVEHQEIGHEHFAATSCDDKQPALLAGSSYDSKQPAPLGWSSCKRLGHKVAEGTIQVEGLRGTSWEKQNLARLGEIQNGLEGAATTQDSMNQHDIASRPTITPEGPSSKEYRHLWSSTVQPQVFRANPTIPLISGDGIKRDFVQSVATPTPVKTRKAFTGTDYDANSVGSPTVMRGLPRSNTSPFRVVTSSRYLISSSHHSRPNLLASATPNILTCREKSANSSLALRAAIGNLGSAFHSTSAFDRQVMEKTTGVERVRSRLHWDAESPSIVQSSVSSTFCKGGANMTALGASSFTQEAMLDAEVALCISGGKVLGRAPVRRELVNPLAKMFEDGDERHFVPVKE